MTAPERAGMEGKGREALGGGWWCLSACRPVGPGGAEHTHPPPHPFPHSFHPSLASLHHSPRLPPSPPPLPPAIFRSDRISHTPMTSEAGLTAEAGLTDDAGLQPHRFERCFALIVQGWMDQ